MSEVCSEVIGFLFRELLNELVEKTLQVKESQSRENLNCSSSSMALNKKRTEITSNEIYEAFRLDLMNFSDLSNFGTRTTRSASKKFLLV